MPVKFKYDDIIIKTILPLGTKADEYDCWPALHWISQEEDGYFSPFAEQLQPEDIVRITQKRRNAVLLSVIISSENRYKEDLSLLALQAAISFDVLPVHPRNVAILPGGHDGCRLARKLMSLGAVILYTDAEELRSAPMLLPFSSFQAAEHIPQELRLSTSGYRFEDEDICYLGAVPTPQDMENILKYDFENMNGNNCFDLGFEFGIYHPWRADFMDFLSFGLEPIKGTQCFCHTNKHFYHSIPKARIENAPGYAKYQEATKRAGEVFQLWEIGQAMYFANVDEEEEDEDDETVPAAENGKAFDEVSASDDGETDAAPTWSEKEDEVADPDARPYMYLHENDVNSERRSSPEALSEFHKKAEKMGIKDLVEAYYSGVSFEDLVGDTAEELGFVLDTDGGGSIVPLFW